MYWTVSISLNDQGNTDLCKINFSVKFGAIYVKVLPRKKIVQKLEFVLATVITWFIISKACWQSGDAADCKSVYTCSIHVHASITFHGPHNPEGNYFEGLPIY